MRNPFAFAAAPIKLSSFSILTVKNDILATDRLDPQSLFKATLIFCAALAAYYLTRSPGLDEIDSVNFTMGVREFNIWKHQPHPPGYPLFIFLGQLGVKVFGASPEASLHFLSALGGALFIASWFLIIRAQFNERLAWWVTTCLAVTPVVWMTATKILTDSLATGLISAEILAAIYFVKRGRLGVLLSASLFGAAATGIRPQLILIALIILVIALRQRRAGIKMSLLAVGSLIGACLLWLLPMWYQQSLLRTDVAGWAVYPKQVYSQWSWRFDRPQTFLFAGDWSPRYLGIRFAGHILGWFGLGFGFLQSWTAFVVGIAIVTIGFVAYLFWRREPSDRQFWKFHAPWALVHIAIIFICLPATQRYYFIIYPLLFVALLRGFFRMPTPWKWSALALPALLVFITIPIAITNHRDDAPPVRLVQYLEKIYPPSMRGHVVLLLSSAKRHAEWYGPDFITIGRVPPPDALPEMTKDAVAVYTDNGNAPLPKGWRRVPLVDFRRSLVIYMKYHSLRLYLIHRGNNS